MDDLFGGTSTSAAEILANNAENSMSPTGKRINIRKLVDIQRRRHLEQLLKKTAGKEPAIQAETRRCVSALQRWP
jgi:hypothetical protein